MAGNIELAKKLFGTVSSTTNGSRANSFSAANIGASTSGTGGSGSDILTQLKYGTCQTDSDGRMVSVLVDGNDDPIDVTTYETLYAGDRVCLITKGSSYKLIAFKAGSVGGNMISVDGAFIDKLVSSEAFIEKLTADSAFIGDLTANTAFIEALSTSFIQTDELDATYARLDVANINKAFVDTLLVQGQYIAQEGTVYYLTGLHVDANDITAGTLTVDRIAIKGDDDEYYMLTPNGDGTFAQTKLNGSILEEHSIKANRIVSNSITTEQITTQNLVGTGGWINLANGTFEYMNASTGNGIAWDGEKLTLHLDELYVDGSRAATADELSNLQNATIKDVQLEYYLSESPTELSGGSWGSDSAWYSGAYLWQRSKVIYGDGTTSYLPSSDGVCVTGNDGTSGKGISSIVEYYAVNSSSTTAPSTWYTSPQSTSDTNKYLWNYSVITYTDGTTDSTAKRIIGTQGTKGTNAADSGYLTWNSSTSTLTVGNTNVSSYGKLNITPSQVSILDSSGDELSSFTGTSVKLAEKSQAGTIDMCNGLLKMTRYANSTGYPMSTGYRAAIEANNTDGLTINLATGKTTTASSGFIQVSTAASGAATTYRNGLQLEGRATCGSGLIPAYAYLSSNYTSILGVKKVYVGTNSAELALGNAIGYSSSESTHIGVYGTMRHLSANDTSWGDGYLYLHTGNISSYAVTNITSGTGISLTKNNSTGSVQIKNTGCTVTPDDYVTANGTDGGWRYRKWNSGLIECWTRVSLSPNWSTWKTNFYIGASDSSGGSYGNYEYPFTMKNPSVQITALSTGGSWAVTTSTGTTSRSPYFKIASSTTAATVYVDIYCRNSTTAY